MGILLAVIMATLSGMAGVYTELIMKKRPQRNVNVQNIYLYVWGIVFNTITIFVYDYDAVVGMGFFHGYSSQLSHTPLSTPQAQYVAQLNRAQRTHTNAHTAPRRHTPTPSSSMTTTPSSAWACSTGTALSSHTPLSRRPTTAYSHRGGWRRGRRKAKAGERGARPHALQRAGHKHRRNRYKPHSVGLSGTTFSPLTYP